MGNTIFSRALSLKMILWKDKSMLSVLAAMEKCSILVLKINSCNNHKFNNLNRCDNCNVKFVSGKK